MPKRAGGRIVHIVARKRNGMGGCDRRCVGEFENPDYQGNPGRDRHNTKQVRTNATGCGISPREVPKVSIHGGELGKAGQASANSASAQRFNRPCKHSSAGRMSEK